METAYFSLYKLYVFVLQYKCLPETRDLLKNLNRNTRDLYWQNLYNVKNLVDCHPFVIMESFQDDGKKELFFILLYIGIILTRNYFLLPVLYF